MCVEGNVTGNNAIPRERNVAAASIWRAEPLRVRASRSSPPKSQNRHGRSREDDVSIVHDLALRRASVEFATRVRPPLPPRPLPTSLSLSLFPGVRAHARTEAVVESIKTDRLIGDRIEFYTPR